MDWRCQRWNCDNGAAFGNTTSHKDNTSTIYGLALGNLYKDVVSLPWRRAPIKIDALDYSRKSDQLSQERKKQFFRTIYPRWTIAYASLLPFLLPSCRLLSATLLIGWAETPQRGSETLSAPVAMFWVIGDTRSWWTYGSPASWGLACLLHRCKHCPLHHPHPRHYQYVSPHFSSCALVCCQYMITPG